MPNCRVERVPLADRRTNITFVGFASPEDTIQQQLPQILLVNEHVVSQALYRDVIQYMPPNTRIRRLESGWMTRQLLGQVFSLLVRCLRDVIDSGRYIVLVIDAASQHLGDEVAKAARRHDIYLACIPAKLTFLLQPLDACIFITFKKILRKLFMEARLNSDDGSLSKFSWLERVGAALREVFLRGGFPRAFAKCGITGFQYYLSDRIQTYVDFARQYPYPALPPSDDELRFLVGSPSWTTRFLTSWYAKLGDASAVLSIGGPRLVAALPTVPSPSGAHGVHHVSWSPTVQ